MISFKYTFNTKEKQSIIFRNKVNQNIEILDKKHRIKNSEFWSHCKHLLIKNN